MAFLIVNCNMIDYLFSFGITKNDCISATLLLFIKASNDNTIASFNKEVFWQNKSFFINVLWTVRANNIHIPWEDHQNHFVLGV